MSFSKAATTGCSARVTTPGSQKCSTPTDGRLQSCRRTTSPDTNILDLGFFNSIQSLQDRTTLSTVNEMIAEIRRAIAAQKPETLGKMWTTLQAVLQDIMLAKSDNTFKLPHVGKDEAVRVYGMVSWKGASGYVIPLTKTSLGYDHRTCTVETRG